MEVQVVYSVSMTERQEQLSKPICVLTLTYHDNSNANMYFPLVGGTARQMQGGSSNYTGVFHDDDYDLSSPIRTQGSTN